MIEWFLFGALGFFLGCLLALMLAPPLWNRAVKLTTRKLEATMPMTLTDIQADKDQLRAQFAIDLRKVEVALDKSKEKATRELIESNKRRVEIQMLNSELASVKNQLQEHQNANRVLQQTIKRRLPDLDSRLKAAKKTLADLETVNTELRNTVASQSEANRAQHSAQSAR
jgi:chromosome segregation ATPase